MDSKYQPKKIERLWSSKWEESKLFSPSLKKNSKAFSIMLPPPNVTGVLHMGHGFQTSIMDSICRYKRMNGYDVLWQPGTDHAGISTEIVVERNLEKENKSKNKLGRDRFIKEVWKWKSKSGNTITSQLRRLGASLDWENEAFTMDEDYAHIVRKVFIELYEKGLIYKKNRLVNWDPKNETGLSDLEVTTREENGNIWHIKYEVGDSFIIVATTRPETMFGDQAIAVHPKDKRYKKLIGLKAKIPFTDKYIPIIADSYVDKDFGTGCLKITPGHDFNDYELGIKHGLEPINILNPDGTLNAETPAPFSGMDRFDARREIIKSLKDIQMLERIEPHKLSIPRAERSDTILEPYMTDQWYLNTDLIGKEALSLVKKKSINFIPDNWKKTYFSWMNELQDWCISRQLWWGHQIPIWYDQDGGEYCGENEKDIRKKYKLDKKVSLVQDQDVLDTWFSSSLWTFATLGWPQQTKRLYKYHPTSLLVTGFDIIFFWVARMIMMTKHFTKAIPFKEIYITGLIRDSEGQKMSKSKGNVLDPLDIIDGINLEALISKRISGLLNPDDEQKIIKQTKKDYPQGIKAHGTDALRFTFLSLASGSRDINFDMKRVEGYRNFCNKLWNASRFIELNKPASFKKTNQFIKTPEDKWIVEKLNYTIVSMNTHMDNYRFDLATQSVYEFVWNDFCDWYIEFSKNRLDSDNIKKSEVDRIISGLLNILESILKLCHPFMPFITEEIWNQIASGKKQSFLLNQSFPKKVRISGSKYKEIENLKNSISSIRNMKAEMGIASLKLEEVFISGNKTSLNFILENSDHLKKLAGIKDLKVLEIDKPCAIVVSHDLKFHIPFEGNVDPISEKLRNEQKLQKVTKNLANIENTLSNKKFISSAPKSLVNERKRQYKQALKESKSIQLHLKNLNKLN